jgi:hypothetical protein
MQYAVSGKYITVSEILVETKLNLPEHPAGQTAPDYPARYLRQRYDASGDHRLITYHLNSKCGLRE